MIYVQSLVILLCFFSVINADGGCNAKMGQDIVKELMDLMLKIKCQSSETNGFQKRPAFVGLLTSNIDLSTNMVIKFDDVVTNIGKGYNAKTGIFTAPKSGVYEFSLNVLKGFDSNWLELNLMKNEKMIARGLCSKSQYSSGSLRVIVELEKIDRVFVKHPRSSGKIHGDKYSMFSGHLMQPS